MYYYYAADPSLHSGWQNCIVCHPEQSEGSASDGSSKGVILLIVDVLLLCCKSFVALRMTKLYCLSSWTEWRIRKRGSTKRSGTTKRWCTTAMLQILRCIQDDKIERFSSWTEWRIRKRGSTKRSGTTNRWCIPAMLQILRCTQDDKMIFVKKS